MAAARSRQRFHSDLECAACLCKSRARRQDQIGRLCVVSALEAQLGRQDTRVFGPCVGCDGFQGPQRQLCLAACQKILRHEQAAHAFRVRFNQSES